MTTRRPALGVLAATLVAPAEALACSSCSYGTGNGMMVYLATAAFMGVLPLAMVAALALWLRRRVRACRTEEAEGDAVPARPLSSVSSPPHEAMSGPLM